MKLPLPSTPSSSYITRYVPEPMHEKAPLADHRLLSLLAESSLRLALALGGEVFVVVGDAKQGMKTLDSKTT